MWPSTSSSCPSPRGSASVGCWGMGQSSGCSAPMSTETPSPSTSWTWPARISSSLAATWWPSSPTCCKAGWTSRASCRPAWQRCASSATSWA
uniref:Alternative protein MRGPRE n=1 Tax=Homo sapiens TaxID=9606 RepID=L8E724_HUMAN|nr:alternative protein MRGPRE [Homo sapiens]